MPMARKGAAMSPRKAYMRQKKLTSPRKSNRDSDGDSFMEEMMTKEKASVRSPAKSPTKPDPKRQKPILETQVNETPIAANGKATRTQPVTDATRHKTPEDAHEDASMSDADTATAGNERAGKGTPSRELFGIERVNWIFYDLSLQIEKSANAVVVGRKALVDWLKAVQEIDETAIVCAYGEDNSLEKNILEDPNAIPESISQISKLFHNFRPKSEGGIIYVSVHLGFDFELENFSANLRTVLNSRNMKAYPKSLQAAHTTNVGWLYSSHGDFEVETWTTWFENQFSSILRATNSFARAPKIGLQVKFLWDGTKKGNTAIKTTEGKKKKTGTRAVFVDFKKGEDTLGATLLRQVLKSAAFRKRCNLVMKLVPKFSPYDDPEVQEKIRGSIFYHEKTLACLTRDFSSMIYNIDSPNQHLEDKTLRELILEMKFKRADGVEDTIVKAIDPKWGRQGGWTFTFPAQDEYKAQASKLIQNLGPFLIFKYGLEVVNKWVTVEAVEYAKLCQWDAENEKVISDKNLQASEAVSVGENNVWLFDLTQVELDREAAMLAARPQVEHLPAGDGSIGTYEVTGGRDGRPLQLPQQSGAPANVPPAMEELGVPDPPVAQKRALAQGFNLSSARSTVPIGLIQGGNDDLDDRSALTDLTSKLTDVTSRVAFVETRMDKILDICSELLKRDQQRGSACEGGTPNPPSAPLAMEEQSSVALVP